MDASRDFPEGPVVKTLSFHCRGCEYIPVQGTKVSRPEFILFAPSLAFALPGTSSLTQGPQMPASKITFSDLCVIFFKKRYIQRPENCIFVSKIKLNFIKLNTGNLKHISTQIYVLIMISLLKRLWSWHWDKKLYCLYSTSCSKIFHKNNKPLLFSYIGINLREKL